MMVESVVEVRQQQHVTVMGGVYLYCLLATQGRRLGGPVNVKK